LRIAVWTGDTRDTRPKAAVSRAEIRSAVSHDLIPANPHAKQKNVFL